MSPSPTEPPLHPVPPAPARTTHLQARALGLVAAGGVLGAPARYALAQALPVATHGFPTATFLTNLSGAFLLGVLVEGLARRGPDEGARRSARLLLGTGLCGAYTTYSTFAVDTDQLFRAGRVGLGVFYALATVLLGLVATLAGIAVAAAHHRRGSALPGPLSTDPDLLSPEPDVWPPDRGPGSPGSPERER